MRWLENMSSNSVLPALNKLVKNDKILLVKVAKYDLFSFRFHTKGYCHVCCGFSSSTCSKLVQLFVTLVLLYIQANR